MSKQNPASAFAFLLFAFVVSNFVFTNAIIGQETKQEKEDYVWKTVSGKVVDEVGQPVKDAYVCHDNLNEHPMNHTSTNEAGEFELKFRASKKYLETGWIWAYSPDHNLRCVTNSRTDDHLIKLPKYTEFKITFLQPDGKPLKQATIRPFRCRIPNGGYDDAESPPQLGGILPNALSAKIATTTDEKGQCLIRSIPRTLWGPVIIKTESHGKHILGGGKTKDSYQLAKTGSLKIEILPDEPIEFNETKVFVHGWGVKGETSLNGKIGGLGICEFEHVIPGEIEISLKIGKDEIYQPKLKKKYFIESGLESHVKIPIKKTVLIEGKVLAEGKPIPNAWLKVGEHRMPRTDENGNFSTRVFPGPISIKVYDMPRVFYTDFETGKAHHFNIKETDRPVKLDRIEIPALTSVLVKIVDENDKPVTGFFVRSIYEGRGYGPLFTPKLNDSGTAIAKVGERGMSILDEASFFLVPSNKKDDKNFSKDKSKRIALTATEDAFAIARSEETFILRCKRADVEKANQDAPSESSDQK